VVSVSSRDCEVRVREFENQGVSARWSWQWRPHSGETNWRFVAGGSHSKQPGRGTFAASGTPIRPFLVRRWTRLLATAWQDLLRAQRVVLGGSHSKQLGRGTFAASGTPIRSFLVHRWRSCSMMAAIPRALVPATASESSKTR